MLTKHYSEGELMTKENVLDISRRYLNEIRQEAAKRERERIVRALSNFELGLVNALLKNEIEANLAMAKVNAIKECLKIIEAEQGES
jgi:predicted glycosyltransferase